MNQNNIQIIGQGTYGCVYRPNIDCQTKKIDSKQFLSKIQRKDKTSKNEIVIGKKIISLPKNIYSNRFAPILESCPIEIGKMEEENSDYKEKYYDKYMTARKESGFKDTQEELQANFMKFLVEDAHLPGIDEDFVMNVEETGDDDDVPEIN